MSPTNRERIVIILSLLPAISVVMLLFGASVIYSITQSLGYLTIIGEQRLSLEAYVRLFSRATAAGREFWPALGFSLWVSIASTTLAALAALLLAVLLTNRQRPTGRSTLLALHFNLAFPHLVWAIALSLLLAQSGLLARIAAALGLITTPADFPVLVRDRYGLGIILHYVTKEISFLTLIVLAVLRAQGAPYDLVAENLGANFWQRLRFVTLPLVLPGLTAGSLLMFAFIFGAYEAPELLGTRFPRMLSVLALESFLNADLHLRAEAMAISITMVLIILAVAGAGYVALVRWRVHALVR